VVVVVVVMVVVVVVVVALPHTRALDAAAHIVS